METLKKTSLFFWDKVFIGFICIVPITCLLLIVLTMPIFGMPRWYHLLVGAASTALAFVSLMKWRHPLGPTGVLIGLVATAICFSVYIAQ